MGDLRNGFGELVAYCFIHGHKYKQSITELGKLPAALTELGVALWGSLVEYVTVGKDKKMVFTFDRRDGG